VRSLSSHEKKTTGGYSGNCESRSCRTDSGVARIEAALPDDLHNLHRPAWPARQRTIGLRWRT